MNEHVLYNVQKSIVEEVKQELLKNTGVTLKKVNKETCRSVARKHKFDDLKK